ncbi:hypothetical protein H5410_062272 [Solanum commersonii]|uniref:Putative plant transposon protein domain-containing protein n=1 Tax=Solanum commersonii TaxID=4109 RepID=A0A9J5WAE9_SOLCO|nr:hypothetical protein H5410_062272 [Solanum commersonii]
MGDEFVNEVRLQSQFPDIYRIVNELVLRFIFENSGDCNLTLVREFYANWLTETKYNIVPVRGKDVKFSAQILNELLGTPNCDPDEFNTLKDKPPYRDIRHTLCGVDSPVRWEMSKDTGRHNTFHFANFNPVARVWLKIVCSVLLLAKHLTEVTRDSVVLVYMLMKGMHVNVGAILRQNMMKFRNNLRWRFFYGRLITFVLRSGPSFLEPLGDDEPTADEAMDNEKEAADATDKVNALMVFDGEETVDMIVAYHPDLMVANRGHPINEEMETLADRYPLIESAAFLYRSGLSFLELLDDDEPTGDAGYGFDGRRQ